MMTREVEKKPEAVSEMKYPWHGPTSNLTFLFPFSIGRLFTWLHTPGEGGREGVRVSVCVCCVSVWFDGELHV